MIDAVTLQVNMNNFTKSTNKDNVIIVRKGNGWVGVSKEEFLKDLQSEIKNLKDENEQLRLQMKGVKEEAKIAQMQLDSKIKNFESILIDYGFNLMRGE